MEFIKLSEIPRYLKISKGDRVFVHSSTEELMKTCKENGNEDNLNDLIDALQKEVGEEGTLIFPTYNLDWCKGVAFDCRNTLSKMDALSLAALERKDFKRTKHPIYSFVVWGKDQDVLCGMDNKSAFGPDSPFAYFLEENVKGIIINDEIRNSFTFVHFVEEQLKDVVPYCYMKNFRADYIDESGRKEKKVYTMLVKSAWYEVEEVNSFEREFIKLGAQENLILNGVKFSLIEFAKTFPIVKKDILQNRSKKICIYKGQNENLSEMVLMYGLVKELFPLCRSITGEGLRNSFQIIKSYLPFLEMFEVKSGTKVFDWEVPEEWNVEEAYIEDEDGAHIIDFKTQNLHLLGYSAPMDEWMDLDELKKYVFTQESQPDVIPYVTSYYKKRSGFCMSKNQLDSLKEGRYHLVIKSDFNKDGSMTYGEVYFPGESEQEIIFSTYLCHPSMANNECSGPAVATFLARYVSKLERRKYSYRFIFAPETIGSITYLSQNYEKLRMKEKVVAGFVLTCVGDNRTYSFVNTRYGNTLTDKLLRNVFGFHCPEYKEYTFLERGSDERQYNAPGIDLPICSVCRSKFGEYPEYHTSADDLSVVTEEGLRGSFDVMVKCIETLEHNDYYKVTILCEPQLGKRGLFPTISKKGQYDEGLILTNLIAYCDGSNDLIDISNRINCDTMKLIPIIKKLLDFNILEKLY